MNRTLLMLVLLLAIALVVAVGIGSLTGNQGAWDLAFVPLPLLILLGKAYLYKKLHDWAHSVPATADPIASTDHEAHGGEGSRAEPVGRKTRGAQKRRRRARRDEYLQ